MIICYYLRIGKKNDIHGWIMEIVQFPCLESSSQHTKWCIMLLWVPSCTLKGAPNIGVARNFQQGGGARQGEGVGGGISPPTVG